MSTLALPRRRENRLTAFFGRIADLFRGVQEGLAMAREYEELSHLTPGELAELGITRADIPRVVARRLIGS